MMASIPVTIPGTANVIEARQQLMNHTCGIS
jgi:hypothetical protein